MDTWSTLVHLLGESATLLRKKSGFLLTFSVVFWEFLYDDKILRKKNIPLDRARRVLSRCILGPLWSTLVGVRPKDILRQYVLFTIVHGDNTL